MTTDARRSGSAAPVRVGSRVGCGAVGPRSVGIGGDEAFIGRFIGPTALLGSVRLHARELSAAEIAGGSAP